MMRNDSARATLKEDFSKFTMKDYKWAIGFALIFSAPFLFLFFMMLTFSLIRHDPLTKFVVLSLFTLPTITWVVLVTLHWAKEDRLPSLSQSIVRNLVYGLAWLGPFFISIMFGLKLLNPNDSTNLNLRRDPLIFFSLWIAAGIFGVIIERIIYWKKKKQYSNELSINILLNDIQS